MASTKGKKISYTCHKATIEKITPQYVIFMENTKATSHGKRQRIGWVSQNMALSREGAWDHAAADLQREISGAQGQIRVLEEGIAKLRRELPVVRNRGKRRFSI